MPRFKRIDLDPHRPCANVAQGAPARYRTKVGDKKMAPKIGAIRQKYNFSCRSRTKPARPGTLDSQDSRDRNAASRRYESRPVRSPSAGGLWWSSAGRTGRARVRGRWKQSWTWVSPFLDGGGTPLRDLGTIYVYQIPETTDLFAWHHFLVCSAA